MSFLFAKITAALIHDRILSRTDIVSHPVLVRFLKIVVSNLDIQDEPGTTFSVDRWIILETLLFLFSQFSSVS